MPLWIFTRPWGKRSVSCNSMTSRRYFNVSVQEHFVKFFESTAASFFSTYCTNHIESFVDHNYRLSIWTLSYRFVTQSLISKSNIQSCSHHDHVIFFKIYCSRIHDKVACMLDTITNIGLLESLFVAVSKIIFNLCYLAFEYNMIQ